VYNATSPTKKLIIQIMEENASEKHRKVALPIIEILPRIRLFIDFSFYTKKYQQNNP
jgi:hypothetical protein